MRLPSTLAVAATLLLSQFCYAEKPVHIFILSGQSNMAGMNPKVGFEQEAAEQFEEGGMNRRAVILLLHDYTRVPKRTIERVLQGVENAVDYYFGEDEDETHD